MVSSDCLHGDCRFPNRRVRHIVRAMDILDRHKAYAAIVLKEPLELWKAGKAAWPEETPYHQNMALNCALNWKDSPEIEEAKRALIEEKGAAYFLPDRYQICREIHAAANSAKTFDDKFKGLKLYAEIMGFIEKPGTSVVTNNTTVNKVMVVPMTTSQDAWESNAIGQQVKVIDHAE